MDPNSGRMFRAEKSSEIDALFDKFSDLTSFEIGETVQVKGCWFEITAVRPNSPRPRLILKPIPRPQ